MGKKIIFIDDSTDLARLVTFKLKREGYDVLYHSSPFEAVGIIEINQPDLILLDYMMPGKNGLQLLKEIKSNSKINSIPIIMLTSRKKEEDVLDCIENGAADYIVKPFSPPELAVRIKRILKD